MPSLIQWFESASFGMRLVVVSAIFDFIGALAGYALHGTLGVDPLIGVVYGVLAGSIGTSMYVAQYVMTHREESERVDA